MLHHPRNFFSNHTKVLISFIFVVAETLGKTFLELLHLNQLHSAQA